MPIIDTKDDKARFDALLRNDKANTLLAFIKASENIESNEGEERKLELANRLKIGYELLREEGPQAYGEDENKILTQFSKHYTMGLEMGIWIDNNFTLSNLAKEVANYTITVREYIGIVFRNLFTYYKVDGKYEYHHFLYEILKIIESDNLVNLEISKKVISDSLPIENNDQSNILYNYLMATDIFIQINKKTFKLSEKWKNNFDTLLKSCNLEYLTKNRECALEMAKNKTSYSDYVSKKIEISSKEEISEKMNFITNLTTDYEHNRIVFGAPGTGKSYSLKEDKKKLLGKDGLYERVTFHPDYSYSQFVGTYKPITNEDSQIVYKYVPGPFMRIYVEAIKNTKTDKPRPYLLIIEEINRANVAAVFGDIFQLLDRDEKNISNYQVHATEDIKKYLVDELGGNPNDYKTIKIPDNMFIWATMNSADQGVYPMDTAFKRRWNFTYVGVDNNEEKIKDYNIKIGEKQYNWNKLRKAINHVLLEDCDVNEDKLMGPFFISIENLKKCSSNSEEFIKVFKNKVIMYLFDDAAKHKRAILFSGCSTYNMYSKVCREFEEKGIGIFSEKIQNNVSIINEKEKSNYSTDNNSNKLVAENSEGYNENVGK